MCSAWAAFGVGFVVRCMDMSLGKRVRKTECAGDDDKYSIVHVHSIHLHVISAYPPDKTSFQNETNSKNSMQGWGISKSEPNPTTSCPSI